MRFHDVSDNPTVVLLEDYRILCPADRWDLTILDEVLADRVTTRNLSGKHDIFVDMIFDNLRADRVDMDVLQAFMVRTSDTFQVSAELHIYQADDLGKSPRITTYRLLKEPAPSYPVLRREQQSDRRLIVQIVDSSLMEQYWNWASRLNLVGIDSHCPEAWNASLGQLLNAGFSHPGNPQSLTMLWRNSDLSVQSSPYWASGSLW